MLPHLPPECVLSIFKRVGVADVIAAGCCSKALHTLLKDEKFWCELSEAKWGAAVLQLKPLADQHSQQRHGEAAHQLGQQQLPATCQANASPQQGGSWFSYASKRMCLRSIRASPLNLLQEAYQDPWQHIICCVLCSRTSGSDSIRATIADFFGVLPTPTAVLEAREAFICSVMRPLGLQSTRLAAVRSVSRDFLATDWQEPSEFTGCGKFVTDSWKIFCKGNRDSKGVDDSKLRQYLSWLNKQGGSAVARQDKAEALVVNKRKRAPADITEAESCNRRVTRSQGKQAQSQLS